MGKRKEMMFDDYDPFEGRQVSVEKKAPIQHRTFAMVCSSVNKDYVSFRSNLSLQLAQRLLQQGLENGKEGNANLACSPLSIDILLAILALGAEGETLKQLLKFVGFDSVEDLNVAAVKVFDHILAMSEGENAPDITFVNGLWLDHKFSLNAKFKDVVKALYRAEARTVDFDNKADEAVKEANSSVEEQSRGLIKEILSNNQNYKGTTMLLANFIYFKGAWYHKFKPENTKHEDFYLLDGQKVKVPFMNIIYNHFEYGIYEDCQVLRMLYEEGEPFQEGESRGYSMYIFLPEAKEDLPSVLQNINLDANLFANNLKLERIKIDKVSIPKFSINCDLSLVEPLKIMGLTLPFDHENKELTGILDCKTEDWLYADEVKQKCHVEANEEGTIAFVVTTVELYFGASEPATPPPPVNFVADHPFMFIIREDFSGSVLYVGTVINPAIS